MGFLTKDEILGANDLKHEDVDMPEWGGKVRVRVMTGTERDEFRTAAAGAALSRFSVAMLAATLIDQNGERLFSMDDIDRLAEKSAASIDKPAGVAMRLNGLGGSAIEDAVKNSGSGQSGDSGSDSPKS